MQIVVEQSDLASALATVGRAAASRSTLPVLSGVHLSAAGSDGLMISATDLELATRARVPARVEQPGEAVLPARYLGEYVRRIPFGQIRIDVDAATHAATLRWERSEHTIRGFPPGEFPAVDLALGSEAVQLDAGLLRRALHQTGFAVSGDESKPALGGVFLRAEGGELLAVATDGFRVALGRSHLGVDGVAMEAVVPGRAVGELSRLLPEGGEVRIELRERQLMAEVGAVAFATRLVDAPYPDVPALIPADYPVTAVLDRMPLVEAAERIAPLADGRQMARWLVVLELQPDRLAIHAQDPEIGQAYEEVAATLTGEPFRIGLNVRYLLDGLRHLDGETLELGLIGPEEPVRLQTREEPGYQHIIYPVRL